MLIELHVSRYFIRHPQEDWVAVDKAYWRSPEGPGECS
jgi:hypothetical protein